MKIKSGGFTLVELLVVIAIVAILAGLLLPGLTVAVAKAKAMHCSNNLRQMNTAVVIYATEYGEYPLFGRGPTAAKPNGSTWHEDILPDISWGQKDTIFRCPTFRGTTSSGGANAVYIFDSLGSYGYNRGSSFRGTSLNVYRFGLSETDQTGLEVRTVREFEVRNPAEMIALGDSFARSYFSAGGLPLREGGATLSRKLAPMYLVGEYGTDLTGSAKRHRGRVNVAFADGHLESETVQRLFFDADVAALRRWHVDNEAHQELFTSW